MSHHVIRAYLPNQLQAAFLAVLTVGIVLSNNVSSADLDRDVIQWKKSRRVAYVDTTVPSSTLCRTGWWQTLRYGHVRPRWGTICY
jgi:hypothetical protein